MITMYDSITVANLPDGGGAYAGYVGGNWATWDAVKATFGGHAHLLSIAVNAGEDAKCLDVEQGDATPAEAPGWVKRQQGRGQYKPVLYASVSAVPAVLAALGHAGIKRDEVRLWSAHYGAGKHICGPASCKWPGVPACDGTQWTDAAAGAGGTRVDESLLTDAFFPAPPPPQPAPPPAADLDGVVVWKDKAGTLHSRGVLSVDGKIWS
jgi:hypothetical protein